jgi:hypothetical protein
MDHLVLLGPCYPYVLDDEYLTGTVARIMERRARRSPVRVVDIPSFTSRAIHIDKAPGQGHLVAHLEIHACLVYLGGAGYDVGVRDMGRDIVL